MNILAIETSCDETAIAVLECSGGLEKPRFTVLANALRSQVELHKEYGGVVPDLAKREHQKNLPVLLEAVFKNACFDLERPNIDLIAVTAGPGLEPALWAGITFAEELGRKWGIQVLPVNHMEGHILSVLYQNGISNPQFPISKELQFPALALLVSGGHTELVLVENFGAYKVIGRTRDDAVGEAFDKVARLLGLEYPGGPKVSALAARAREGVGNENSVACSRSASGQSRPTELSFPIPMVHSGDLDFSYSGLKTAVLYKVKGLGTLSDSDKAEIARAFEDAAIGELLYKTRQALDEHPVETLIVGGGVSANRHLRATLTKLMEEYPETALRFPAEDLTTDNAVMIGIAAYIESFNMKAVEPIRARGNLTFAERE